MVSSPPNTRDSSATQWSLVALVAAGLIWSYWSTLTVLQERWGADPLYAHGYLVPFVAAGIAWWRKDQLKQLQLEPSLLLGLPLLVAGIGLRLTAAKLYLEWFDGLSLVPCVAGLVLMFGGLPLLKVFWPAVVYLAFMVPLPFRLEAIASGPLQSIATMASTFSLQLMGFPAGNEGNVITINEARIGVAEACSGLRMLVVFFAATAAVALCSTKPLWERAIVLLSAVPIAIACNVIRITATGVLFETLGSATAKAFFHDFAGWLMMLLAVGLLKLELWFWANVMIDPPAREVVPVGRVGVRVARPVQRTESSTRSTTPERVPVEV